MTWISLALDEGDPISGRGYCTVRDGQLVGRLFQHFGDELAFSARRIKGNASA
jgi:hypothetical protein